MREAIIKTETSQVKSSITRNLHDIALNITGPPNMHLAQTVKSSLGK